MTAFLDALSKKIKVNDKLFSTAVERYNAKQKRSDRKIKTDYFEYQFGQPVTETKLTSPDKRKSFYECLIQLGEFESIEKCAIDSKIRENMELFIEPHRTNKLER